MTIHHEIYRGPANRPASRFVCEGCGEEFEPAVTVLLDSSLPGVPDPYGKPLYYRRPQAPYTPYRKLLVWLEAHRGCAGRAEVRTWEGGVEVVDRRGKR